MEITLRRLIYLIIVFIPITVTAFIFIPSSNFPQPSGKYGVGKAKYHWIDESRKEPNTQDPEHPNRELMVYVYYPTANENQGKYEYYDHGMVIGYTKLMSYMSGIPSWLFSGLSWIKTHSVPNAEIMQSDTKLPVIIVSHGWGAQIHGWTLFCELLASNGYFVVGISHPYVAELTRYPDDRIIETLVFKKAAERKKEGGEERYRAWKESQVEICAQDMSSAITKLNQIDKNGSEFWSGKIDLGKIGVLGGSFGGTTSFRACRKDERVSCGIDMDGCLRGEDVSAELSKPFMFMIAQQSNQWVDERGIQDLAAIDSLVAKSQPNVHKEVFKNIGHAAFSDVPFILNSTLFTRLVSKYVNFIGVSDLSNTLSVSDTCVEMERINSCIVEFFDKKLRKNMIKGDAEIRGNIITLRPLCEQFFEEYHRMFSPTVRQAVGLSPTSNFQETSTFLSAAMVDPQHLMFYCIFDNQTGKLIGSVVIRSPEHPNGQLGAWINENFWGGGRYQEALCLALKIYFDSTEHNSISAFVEVSNVRSLKAHQKMGFVIVEKLLNDKNRLQGKQSHKIVLTHTAFGKAQKRFEGKIDADK